MDIVVDIVVVVVVVHCHIAFLLAKMRQSWFPQKSCQQVLQILVNKLFALRESRRGTWRQALRGLEAQTLSGYAI